MTDTQERELLARELARLHYGSPGRGLLNGALGGVISLARGMQSLRKSARAAKVDYAEG